MKNITLSAEDDLIARAREEARRRKTTLNALFREWLQSFTGQEDARRKATEAIEGLSKHLAFDRKPNRDELNER